MVFPQTTHGTTDSEVFPLSTSPKVKAACFCLDVAFHRNTKQLGAKKELSHPGAIPSCSLMISEKADGFCYGISLGWEISVGYRLGFGHHCSSARLRGYSAAVVSSEGTNSWHTISHCGLLQMHMLGALRMLAAGEKLLGKWL